MGAIFLPQRWRQQPQGALLVDWNNPLSAGLVSVVPYSDSAPRDVVTKKELTVGGTQRPLVATPFGRGVSFSAVATDYLRISTPSGLTAYSAAVLYSDSRATGGAARSVLSRDNSSSERNFRLECYAKDSQYVAVYYNTSSRLDIYPAAKLRNGVTALAASFGDGQAYVAANGLSYNSAIPGTLNTLYADIEIGRFFNSEQGAFAGQVLLSAIWARALRPGELAEWTNHPWQLFKPQRRVLYSLPSAASLYFEAIDETTSNRADGWVATAAGAVQEVGVTIPALAAGTGVTINFDAKTLGAAQIQVEVYNGATLLKTATVGTSADGIASITVTAGDLASVTTWPLDATIKVTSL